MSNVVDPSSSFVCYSLEAKDSSDKIEVTVASYTASLSMNARQIDRSRILRGHQAPQHSLEVSHGSKDDRTQIYKTLQIKTIHRELLIHLLL